jgi:hypothetical protein
MLNFLDRKLSTFILFFSLPLLLLPKINIVSLGSETAGLRIDDLFLFLFGALFFFCHTLLRKPLYKIEGWILTLTVFSIVSFLSNRVLVSAGSLHMDAKIFYAVRLLEYFLFFYLGTLAFRFDCGKLLIKVFFIWNFLLMTLQKLNLAGGVSIAGYSEDVSTRVQGIASFPSEMGLLLNLLFCYMLYDPSNQSRFVNLFVSPLARHILRKGYPYFLFALFGIFVVFTGNRISIVALCICFIGKIKEEFTWRTNGSIILAFIIIPLLVGSVGYFISQTDAVYSRSLSLLSMKNVELTQIVWDKIDMKKNPVGNEVIESNEFDMSWWMRIHKWVYVVKVFVTHPEAYLQGLGPGFAWSALDGGILRIFVEYGLIGTFLFWKFFSSLYRINRQLKWMTIAFAINMIFFDAYLAYKTMSFFFFAAGLEFESAQREEKQKMCELTTA